jgi:L-arabinonolactonase
MNAHLVHDVANTLGEGILWSEREQALYWTDIHAAMLWRLEPASGALRQWNMPERLGCLALCETDGWLLLGLASRLAFFHPQSETLLPLLDVEPGLPTRLNDGACDRQGRFVFGTLHEPGPGETRQPVGAFYRLNTDLTLERLNLPGVSISNSIAFSPDGGTMYFCDSPSRLIHACDYGDRCGEPRVFAREDDPRGEPDGSAIDAEGFLWNAQWGLGRVLRYAPDGRVDRVIEVPATQPTRPAFGGPRFDTLYITSARDGLSAEALAVQPLAGALFAAEPGVAGLPEPRFRGRPPEPSRRA